MWTNHELYTFCSQILESIPKIRFATVYDEWANRVGGGIREGVTNLFYNHEKKELATNKMLIERVVKFADEVGRKVATAQEVRDLLGINPK